MSMLENYRPEDITPSMRKYLGMPEAAKDEGTSEGAKKGWDTRKHGGNGVSQQQTPTGGGQPNNWTAEERPVMQAKWHEVSKNYNSPYATMEIENEQDLIDTWDHLKSKCVPSPRTDEEMKARNDLTAFALANRDWNKDFIQEEVQEYEEANG